MTGSPGLGRELLDHVGALDLAAEVRVVALVALPAALGVGQRLRRPLPQQHRLLEGQELGVDDRQLLAPERLEQAVWAPIVARASGTSSAAPTRQKSFCMSTTTRAGFFRRCWGLHMIDSKSGD
jgi:hypothetical protein